MGLDERAHAGYVLHDSSLGVEGKPLTLKLKIVGLALSKVSLIVQMVNPEVAYDGWRMELIGHLSQSEGQGQVQGLLGNIISIVQFKDLGLNILDLRAILLVQIEMSST